jgi:hypothetical protein
MKSAKPIAGIPPEIMAELKDACEKLARGERDLEAAKKAAEEMDRMREENRKRFGVQNVAVDLNREARNQDDSMTSIRQALVDMENGDRGRPIDEVLADIRRRYGLPSE